MTAQRSTTTDEIVQVAEGSMSATTDPILMSSTTTNRTVRARINTCAAGRARTATSLGLANCSQNQAAPTATNKEKRI